MNLVLSLTMFAIGSDHSWEAAIVMGRQCQISTEEVVIVRWIEGNKGRGNNIPCTTNFEFEHILVQGITT